MNNKNYFIDLIALQQENDRNSKDNIDFGVNSTDGTNQSYSHIPQGSIVDIKLGYRHHAVLTKDNNVIMFGGDQNSVVQNINRLNTTSLANKVKDVCFTYN
eukprot:CAMPEP_0116908978 /NCGR_PEP_ID=MMETSP0467-20121206/14001_1 /TAXON_ID=283647 /ORGANISM="Mesodinium pulex, Strain SPMC105" /LENGTH=100 /DNA_ID=CAMNT_0004584247 /DNA_START=575 /DNA_END=877 /DNA_ORIENTATION=-